MNPDPGPGTRTSGVREGADRPTPRAAIPAPRGPRNFPTPHARAYPRYLTLCVVLLCSREASSGAPSSADSGDLEEARSGLGRGGGKRVAAAAGARCIYLYIGFSGSLWVSYTRLRPTRVGANTFVTNVVIGAQATRVANRET